MIRDRVDAAKKEMGDVFELFFDETDNKSQILDILKEAGEAGFSGYQLFGGLAKEDRIPAILDILDAVKDRFKAKYLKYSDEVEPA